MSSRDRDIDGLLSQNNTTQTERTPYSSAYNHPQPAENATSFNFLPQQDVNLLSGKEMPMTGGSLSKRTSIFSSSANKLPTNSSPPRPPPPPPFADPSSSKVQAQHLNTVQQNRPSTSQEFEHETTIERFVSAKDQRYVSDDYTDFAPIHGPGVVRMDQESARSFKTRADMF